MAFARVSLALLMLSPAAGQEDLRDRVGTRSLEAAQAFEEGMGLVQRKQFDAGVKRLKKAVEADPDLALAHYWMGIAHVDTGELDAAIACYEAVVEIGRRTRVTNVTIDGCLSAGLSLALVGKEESAWPWFTRAILLDPEDRHKMAWKAYRNMSIALVKKGRNLSAATCAVLGYIADPTKVEQALLQELIEKVGDDEVAQVLHFPPDARALTARSAPAKLQPAGNVEGVEGAVSNLLLEPVGGRVFAFVEGSERYAAVSGSKATPLSAPGVVRGGTAAGGHLYLSIQGPPRLVRVNPADGKVLKTWDLPCEAPAMLAVVAPENLAAFPVQGVLCTLDLDSGQLAKTTFSATGVETDPTQRFVYAFVRPEERARLGHILVDGRPVFFQAMDNDWAQSTFYRFAVAKKKVLLASLRMNAASNGRYPHVSPDGRWAMLVGGGGWRPPAPGPHKAGYAVAVLRADDFSAVQGSFETDAYPLGAAVNPATGQIAVVREQDAKIYHLARPDAPALVAGPFSALCSWSADGRQLFVAAKAGGLKVFSNELTKEEDPSAWRADLAARVPKAAATSSALKIVPLAELATFKPATAKADVVRALQKAEKEGRTTKPVDWSEYEPYAKDADLARLLLDVQGKLNAGQFGPAIFQLRERKAKVPEHPALELQLGVALFKSGQPDKALPHFLASIKADQGRTNASVEALRGLAYLLRDKGDAVGAAHCFVLVLTLDLARAEWKEEAAPFFQKAGVEAEARKVLDKAGASGGTSMPELSGKLPALPKPASGAAMKSVDLYKKAAPSVVRLQSGDGGGSGVCVGEKGLILTNAHVVGEARAGVDVHFFTWESGKLKRGEPRKATVVYLNVKEDVAVLRVENPPATLVPLPVADRDALAGEKVLAIGSPGLGNVVLDQSLTEGIVSAPDRALNRLPYVQHTAAVNPGNSGGPLLDERGQVLGLVTLKAELENVGFAIPARRIRQAFAPK